MNRIVQTEKTESIKKQVEMTDNAIKAMEEMNRLKDKLLKLDDDNLKEIAIDDEEGKLLLKNLKCPVLRDLENYYKGENDCEEFPVDLELMFIAGFEPQYPQRLAEYILEQRGIKA